MDGVLSKKYYKSKFQIMSAKILVKDIHVKLIALTMCFIGMCLFSVIPFLKKGKLFEYAEQDIAKICNVNEADREWKYIVLHHSATQEGNAASFNNYHKNKKKWKYGLAYHFVIGNGSQSKDGEIEEGPRWKKQIHGAHTSSMAYNKVSIGICLVGNFEEQTVPTERQLESLLSLVQYLCKRYDISVDNVIGHNQIKKGHTVCPGKNFPFDEFKRKLGQSLSN